jgi:peptidase C39-like protein/WD40 repeat protein
MSWQRLRSRVLVQGLTVFAAVLFATGSPFTTLPSVQAATHVGADLALSRTTDATITYAGSAVQLAMNGMMRTVATDEPRRMHPLFAQYASVSPDGTTLLYITADALDFSNTTFTLVNLRTLQKHIVASLGNQFWVHAPRWSPDSQRILYVRAHVTTLAPEIWMLDASTAKSRFVFAGGALTHRSLEGFEQNAPNWSADGRSIVFFDSAYKPTKEWSIAVVSGSQSATLLSQPDATAQTPAPDLVCCGGGGGPLICALPLYSQNNAAWSGITMLSGGHKIGPAGCALTSLTMLFDYYGSTVGNPGGMASCLNPWNYADGLNWYGAQVNPPNGPGCDRYTTNFINSLAFSWSTVDSYLRAGHPVIVGICFDGPACTQPHFFIVVGGDGSDNEANYWINDPIDGNQKQMSAYSTAYLNWMVLYQPASGTWPACE